MTNESFNLLIYDVNNRFKRRLVLTPSHWDIVWLLR
jgi:hypothetical protein